jgi:ribosomal protein L24E
MPEPTRCYGCGQDVHRHATVRYVEYDGRPRVFCSDLCEFLWRRKNRPENEEVFGPMPDPLAK